MRTSCLSLPTRSPGLGLVLVLLAAWLAGPVACAEKEAPTGLAPEEQRLVRETLELMHLRVERARDPERAAALRDSLGGFLSEEELQSLLDRIGQDPARAQAVVEAIAASLRVRRKAWFPEGLASPRPRTTP